MTQLKKESEVSAKKTSNKQQIRARDDVAFDEPDECDDDIDDDLQAQYVYKHAKQAANKKADDDELNIVKALQLSELERTTEVDKAIELLMAQGFSEEQVSREKRFFFF